MLTDAGGSPVTFCPDKEGAAEHNTHLALLVNLLLMPLFHCTVSAFIVRVYFLYQTCFLFLIPTLFKLTVLRLTREPPSVMTLAFLSLLFLSMTVISLVSLTEYQDFVLLAVLWKLYNLWIFIWSEFHKRIKKHTCYKVIMVMVIFYVIRILWLIFTFKTNVFF